MFRNLFLFIAVSTAGVATVRGDMIRFTFEGEIVTVAGSPGVFSSASLGDSFSFSYVFDSELMDSNPDPNFGSFDPAMLSAPTLTVDSTTVNTWTSSNIMVINDMDGDSYIASVSDGAGLAASIEVLDSTGTALSSDALPTTLELSDFDAVAGYVFITGDGEGSENGFIQGHISTFSAVVLPVPGAVWMGAIGLALVAVGRKVVG